MFSSNGPSVADIAAVTGNGRNGDGWGNDWWAVIIILALFGGFGNRGGLFGGYGGSNGSGCGCCAPATCQDLQNGFNNQAVTNKLNGLENGLCSLGYDQLSQMNNIGTQIQQGNFALQQAINNASVANMQDTNSISRQLADCCCESREAIMNVRFQQAQDTCAVTNAIANQTNQIIQNDNANYRALHDELVAYQMQQKDETIADLRTQVQAFNLAVSQRNQNDYLIDKLQPCPTPAYVVPNPNCCYNYGNFGFNNGCGCNNGCC
jgi:hypothetical protein